MILISVLIFSVVTGTVFAIVTSRINNKKKEVKTQKGEWYDDF